MTSKGSDQTARMRRLIGGFAGCTYHFVGNVMHWLKSFVKGKRFSNSGSLVSKFKAWLHTQPAAFYGRGLHICIKLWEKYITLAEAYVDKHEYLYQDRTLIRPLEEGQGKYLMNVPHIST